MLKIVFLYVFIYGAANDVLARSHGKRNKWHDGGKIVGGTETNITSYPYQVYVEVLRGVLSYGCGGSILSDKYVLTAAHCLTGVSRVRVRAGSTSASSGGTRYTTFLYKIHPDYDPITSDNDIGIIRMVRKMTLDGVNTRAVALPSADTVIDEGQNVVVTGWGATSEGGSGSDTLMVVTVPVVSLQSCNETYSNSITPRMFCAGYEEGGKDSCQGDSGGPAVDETTGEQLGVVSFGRGCARPNVPGVYTNVVEFLDWIAENTSS
ncbi:trypsin-3-like [Galleria mellonella]|uniref:Trypsin-3-like n=1 Tax=Galleria mellonella TaxID=7137 RepID=A0A6J3BUE5_GALME|nr:trypsin-3-like [Galleria mellonella]